MPGLQLLPLVGQVSQSNNLRFKRYIQKCTLPHLLMQVDGIVQNEKIRYLINER